MPFADLFQRTVIWPGLRKRTVRHPLDTLADYVRLFRDFRHYQQMSSERVSLSDIYPCIHDRTSHTSVIGGLYTYQDTWAARHIAQVRPKHHVDVASSPTFILQVACVTEVVTVDIRPFRTSFPGITAKQGDVLNMPFADGSLESVSSLSVIEHVGLGRYGGELDPDGTAKAARELSRILAPGGSLYVAVPTEHVTRVHFNAHRAFTPEDFIALFPLRLTEETYAMADRYLCRCDYDRIGRPYAFGCFRFTK